MTIAYAPRPIWIPCEPDAGVVFHQCRILTDGSIGSARYWHHAAGRWDSMFTTAGHVRKLTRGLAAVARSVQGFAVPTSVAVDPTTSATVFLLAEDGSIKSVLTTIPAADLAIGSAGVFGLAT